MTDYQGIDYGLGRTNIDTKTGIRYGIISSHSLNPDVIYDVMSDGADYGDAHCPKCGNDAIVSGDDRIPPTNERLAIEEQGGDWTYEGNDYACLDCKYTFPSDMAFPDESIGWKYEQDGYALTDCLDSDVFVILSPFYTYAQFCSPCVPGACSLDSPMDTTDGIRSYCLGHDWFENDRAPYRVFRVSDNSEVFPEVSK